MKTKKRFESIKIAKSRFSQLAAFQNSEINPEKNFKKIVSQLAPIAEETKTTSGPYFIPPCSYPVFTQKQVYCTSTYMHYMS